MNAKTAHSIEALEIKRLTALLPREIQSQVTILLAQETSQDLIVIQKLQSGKYVIQISFNVWQQLNSDQRSLIFWHAVARIQGQKFSQSSWESVVMSIGSIALLSELLTQNLLGIVTTLAIVGLTSYRLYQQHRGERALRAASAADWNAIRLAVQCGYSFPKAYDSLYSALQTLSIWKSQKPYREKYQLRLNVLDVLNAKEALGFGSTKLPTSIPSLALVSPLCS